MGQSRLSVEDSFVVLKKAPSNPEEASEDYGAEIGAGDLGLPKDFTHGPKAGGINEHAAGPPLAEITHAADERELEEENSRVGDRETWEYARIMETKLIEPFDLDASVEGQDPDWGRVAIKADRSNEQFTGRGVKVAILDTGLDEDHPAFLHLAGAIEQKDFTEEGLGDKKGHGTHCAGTIFGGEVNGHQIGIAPGVEKVFIGKVLRNDGSGDTQMLMDGLRWAVAQNVDVISISLGFDFPGYVKRQTKAGVKPDIATSKALVAYRENLRLLDSFVEYASEYTNFGNRRGTILIAASGNESRIDEDPRHKIAVSLPAAAQDVISVGAIQKGSDGSFEMAPFSNIMPEVCAPGVGIYSANANYADDPNNLQNPLIYKSGTSMACPHVAGVAALWWEALLGQDEKTDADQVRECLLARATIHGFGSIIGKLDRGRGLITAPQPGDV